MTYEQYLRDSAVPRDVLDAFLDESQRTWARFDPELGYTLGNSMRRDGIDGSSTLSTAQANGARRARVYVDRPCRINTYGNSFTQCHQVSDGETWQEYLAAHFGEPIGNFGMGGYGTYQAYRRMVRTEQSDDGASLVVFYIWGDDHCRSVMRCRHAAIYPWWHHAGGFGFHNNFWANVEMDLDSGLFVERENMLPTPEALYRMTDPDFMVEALKDDLMVQLYAAERVDPASLSTARLKALADQLGVAGLEAGAAGEDLAESALLLRNAYGFAATRYILKKAADFCQDNGRQLQLVLLCPKATRQLLQGEPRYDQEIVDYIEARNWPLFDMNLVHAEDFKSFNLSIKDYMKRYYIGHYSPAGNHFFAFSIKDTLVNRLDPKPITYLADDEAVIDFKGYLAE